MIKMLDYVVGTTNAKHKKMVHLQNQTNSSSLMARRGALGRFIHKLSPEGDVGKWRKLIEIPFPPFALSSLTAANLLPQKPSHIHIVLP